ncbi:hypothetical protein Pyrfu_0951 [Pyrolobus fumarii 1A]|uniref:Uncharacterized protein n=1 Tax=Pyrolobus fumarii (strain DSM 11204 / 1A) TaxID=694429 RepID=G0EEC6_PYRF1|nr:hypothetical protein [Pyrolobus fumarii]AEM38820.1 hypothetical protein Pyrfu_0951 [Pyrolobus fumarii 1A]
MGVDMERARRMVSRVMRNAGLHVEELRVQTKNLLGQVVEESKVMGVREGRYKVTWSGGSSGRVVVRVTLHARDEDSARRAAERLESLGANVDVAEQRVHAVFRVRGDGVKQVLDSIDVAEKATRGGDEL